MHGDGVSDGRKRTGGFTSDTAGGQRVFMARPKPAHGLARAVRRGLANMKIQAYLTAAAVNLKRLAATFVALLLRWIAPWEQVLDSKLPRRCLQ